MVTESRGFEMHESVLLQLSPVYPLYPMFVVPLLAHHRNRPHHALERCIQGARWKLLPPQQTTLRSTRMPQVWAAPTVMALKDSLEGPGGA